MKELIKLGAEVQQHDVLWTNIESIAKKAEQKGFKVNSMVGVRGFSAYIFIK